MTTSALDANCTGLVVPQLPLPLPPPNLPAADAVRTADAVAWQREMARAQLDCSLAPRTLPAGLVQQAQHRIGAVLLPQPVEAMRSVEARGLAEATRSAEPSDCATPAPSEPAQASNEPALEASEFAGAVVLVQTVLGTQGLPHMMSLALEEVGASSDVPVSQSTKAPGPTHALSEPAVSEALSPPAEPLVQRLGARPPAASAFQQSVADPSNTTDNARAADLEFSKAPPGVLPAIASDSRNSISFGAQDFAPPAPPIPVRQLAERAVTLVWSHSADKLPPAMALSTDLSNHPHGELSTKVSRGFTLQQRPAEVRDPFMAPPNSSPAKRGFATGTASPAHPPIPGGSRSAPAEPVRIHAEWSNAGVKLWLGMDADMLTQVDQISSELHRWLAREGIKVLSMACNGKPFVEYTRTKHGHHSD